MRKLEDKLAIVTGASKGIGASIARHLAARAMSARTLRRGPRSGASASPRTSLPRGSSWPPEDSPWITGESLLIAGGLR